MPSTFKRWVLCTLSLFGTLCTTSVAFQPSFQELCCHKGLSFPFKQCPIFYFSNFISGFVECVACVVIIPALSRFGRFSPSSEPQCTIINNLNNTIIIRVKIYSGTFLAGGLACVLVAVILWVTAKVARRDGWVQIWRAGVQIINGLDLDFCKQPTKGKERF